MSTTTPAWRSLFPATRGVILAQRGRRFGVTPDGHGLLGYRWLYSGPLIPGTTNRTLILTNITAAASGSYYVELSNAFGTTLSSAAFLNILPVALCSNVTGAADSSTCMATASVD